jgi:hypothetical protein
MNEKIDEVARIICARSMGGFCFNVGGRLGCEVGRGTSDRTQCVASYDQLVLSGYVSMADEIRAALATPEE